MQLRLTSNFDLLALVPPLLGLQAYTNLSALTSS